MPKVKDFFTEKQLKDISEIISKAEASSTGEIRVHLHNSCKEDVVIKEAWKRFAKLEMHKTQDRNGVLIFISVQDRQMAIVADEGINRCEEEGTWERFLAQLVEDFSKGEIEEGLKKCILTIGEELAKFFPKTPDSNNTNELTNDVSFE
jgi:uncharacterized membrane protein